MLGKQTTKKLNAETHVLVVLYDCICEFYMILYMILYTNFCVISYVILYVCISQNIGFKGLNGPWSVKIVFIRLQNIFCSEYQLECVHLSVSAL